eukprot:TRINITY_DN8838_c0_g2_i1.p1 TRINITY_DN8838_c0_g2~~TRINITY_DN8838_c0_g2_i1.p1  ORF type:complete len:236 (-),score=58.94 TRINITY_DN8838_c0_g2_i1:521-1228(-)
MSHRTPRSNRSTQLMDTNRKHHNTTTTTTTTTRKPFHTQTRSRPTSRKHSTTTKTASSSSSALSKSQSNHSTTSRSSRSSHTSDTTTPLILPDNLARPPHPLQIALKIRPPNMRQSRDRLAERQSKSDNTSSSSSSSSSSKWGSLVGGSAKDDTKLITAQLEANNVVELRDPMFGQLPGRTVQHREFIVDHYSHVEQDTSALFSNSIVPYCNNVILGHDSNVICFGPNSSGKSYA